MRVFRASHAADVDVSAVAQIDGTPDAQSQSSVTEPTPLSVSAASTLVDTATAGAIAGPGVLTTSADASAVDGITSAAAAASFAGSFVNTRPVLFTLDFTPLDFADGNGGGTTSLFVLLMSGGSTIFSDFVSGTWEFEYYPVDTGAISRLELVLSSEANAGFLSAGVGSAASFGLVSFAANVPVPSTWLLVGLGLAGLAIVRPQRGG